LELVGMKYRNRLLVLLFSFSTLTYIDRVCISVAGQDIQVDLGLTPSEWGWVLGAFSMAYALFEIPTGFMGDRTGPRRTITRIVLWWSVFTVLTGYARSFWHLVATRFLFGVGEAGAYPNASIAIARWFPTWERARAQGYLWMASRVGGALSPFLVIPIQQAYGWRAVFIAFGLVGILWIPVWYWWFRDNPADKPGITPAELEEIRLGGATRRAHEPMPWRQALRSRNLWWVMAMYYTYCWSAFFYLAWMHTFLEKGRDYSKADLMAYSWLPFVFGAFANMLGGYASDFMVKRVGLKRGRGAIGVTGLGLSAGFIALAFMSQDKFLCVLFLALGYASSDFMVPSAWAVCLDIGGKYSGTVSGAMNTAGQVGSFCTVVAFGYIVDAFQSYNAPLVPIALMTAVSALIWLKIDPTIPLVKDDAPSLAASAAGAPSIV
jgi:MFS family permease